MRKNKQKGFGALEALLIILVIVIIGAAGWYVWNKHNNSKPITTSQSNSSSTPAPKPQLAVYKRTTTIPTDWKTYTNTTYKFTAQYPADWHTDFHESTVKVGDTSQNDYSKNATKIAQLCYLPKGVTQMCDGGELTIANQSLQDTVDQYKKTVTDPTIDTGTTILAQKSMTVDGNPAVEFRIKQVNSNVKNIPVSDQYFVYANGNTYAMPTVYESDDQGNPLTAKESLMIFEAIKIQ